MKVIYYCYGSSHSSVVAAAIHLGQLPADRKPSALELNAVGDLDRTRSEAIGLLNYQGKDEAGHEVFTLGVGSEQDLVIQSIKSMILASGGDLREYVFRGALPSLHALAKIGGTLSRRYGYVDLGRSLCHRGILEGYDKLVEFVKESRSLTQ